MSALVSSPFANIYERSKNGTNKQKYKKNKIEIEELLTGDTAGSSGAGIQ